MPASGKGNEEPSLALNFLNNCGREKMKRMNKLASLLLVTAMATVELNDIPARANQAEEKIVIAEEGNTGDEIRVLSEDDILSDSVLETGMPEDTDPVNIDKSDEIYYESVEPDIDEEITADGTIAIETAEGVTQEMCDAGYWNDKTVDSGIGADEELISKEEIKKLNKEMLAAKDANMNDIINLNESYDADKLRHQLAAGTTTAKPAIYADHIAVSPTEYYKKVADAIEETGYTDTNRKNQYAIAVKRTTINNIPVNAYIGYSANDPDDEKVNSALLVGEPFVVRQKASVFGDDFYWGYSDNCTGWVSAENVAICGNKEEWLDAWELDRSGDDFIVVTQNQITLEPSVSMPELSEVKLTFATILKTVPEDKIPESLAERGPWNNIVVYLPVRDGEGKYVKRIALISQHYEVSRGFLKMTQAQILRLAFNSLGDRYGWGGMLDSMDCSFYTRNVYRCFGLQIPRNTSWQQAIPGRKIDLSKMSDDQKLEAMKLMPAGTLFYFPGHTMIYTGTTVMDGKKMAYVISDCGSLSDSTGDLKVRNMYSVILNPLSVRRKAGTTWLNNITAAVLPVSEGCYDFVRSNIEAGGNEEPVSVNRVPAAEGQTYASSKDTIPLETFLGNTQDIFISFYNVEGSGVENLTATVIKGSRITTKVPVNAVRCDKTNAACKISKKTGLASVTMKKSGKISFDMADGRTYDVYFTVESPKARTAEIKNRLKEVKESSADTVSLNIYDLLGTQIDNGMLKIETQKKNTASVYGNKLILEPKVNNTIRISYSYLNKKYSMTINVK